MPTISRKMLMSFAAGATALCVIVAPSGRGAVMLERAAAQPAAAPNVAVTPSGVSAMGIGYVPASAQSPEAQALLLHLAVQERVTSADARSGVQSLRAKLGALTAALGRVGISASAVHIGNLSVAPFYGPAPGSTGSGAGPQSVHGYLVTENLQVDISGSEQLADAIQVGAEAGATSMSANPRGLPPSAASPDPATLAPAVAHATADAKTLARAVAQSAGIRLGNIQSVTVGPPLMAFVGPAASAWRVQVTVTYGIAGSSP